MSLCLRPTSSSLPSSFSFPLMMAFRPAVLLLLTPNFLISHGGCFSPPILRFRLGQLPLAVYRRLSSSVFGPVDRPPCRRHWPLPYRAFRLQGLPALVPHVCPGNMRPVRGNDASISVLKVFLLLAQENTQHVPQIFHGSPVSVLLPARFEAGSPSVRLCFEATPVLIICG